MFYLPARWLVIFLGAIWVILLSGCSPREPNPASPSATTVATTSKVLRYGNGPEPQDLDPHVATGVPEGFIISALLEGLVTYSRDGGIAPGVAERWDTSADGLVWTFHLRANAKWSNGDPVTAQDFAGSFQRILTPSFGGENIETFAHILNAEAFAAGRLADFSQVGVHALDARTLQLTLIHRVPFLLNLLAFYPAYPVHLRTLEKFGGLTRRGGTWTRPGNFVGNGPFSIRKDAVTSTRRTGIA